jgi:hypothetical protein
MISHELYQRFDLIGLHGGRACRPVRLETPALMALRDMFLIFLHSMISVNEHRIKRGWLVLTLFFRGVFEVDSLPPEFSTLLFPYGSVEE